MIIDFFLFKEPLPEPPKKRARGRSSQVSEMINSNEIKSSGDAKTREKSGISEFSQTLSKCVESEPADKSKQTADKGKQATDKNKQTADEKKEMPKPADKSKQTEDKGKQVTDKNKQTADEKKEMPKRRVSEPFGKIKHHNFVMPVLTPPKRNGRRSLPIQKSDKFEKVKSKNTKKAQVKKEEVYDFEEITLKQIKPINVEKSQAQMLEIDQNLSKNAKIDKLTEKAEIDKEDLPLKLLKNPKRKSDRLAKTKQNCDKRKSNSENSDTKNEALLVNETVPIKEKNLESNSESVGKIDDSMQGISQENKEV